MDYQFAGLPLHVLLVHAVVVLFPLIGLSVVLTAAIAPMRRTLWVVNLIAAAALVALVYVTIEAGRWLEQRVPAAPLIQAHTAVGDELLPWAFAVLGAAVLVALQRRTLHRFGATAARVITVVLTAATVTVLMLSSMTLVRIGEAGTRAVWSGSFSDVPLQR